MNATTKTVKGYFRNDKRFGRTTKLVNKATGSVLIEVMGSASKAACIRALVSAA